METLQYGRCRDQGIVVRNTFLEQEGAVDLDLFGDVVVQSRRRTQSDLTDTKLPWKVPFGEFHAITRHRLSSDADTLPSSMDVPLEPVTEEGENGRIPPPTNLAPWQLQVPSSAHCLRADSFFGQLGTPAASTTPDLPAREPPTQPSPQPWWPGHGMDLPRAPPSMPPWVAQGNPNIWDYQTPSEFAAASRQPAPCHQPGAPYLSGLSPAYPAAPAARHFGAQGVQPWAKKDRARVGPSAVAPGTFRPALAQEDRKSRGRKHGAEQEARPGGCAVPLSPGMAPQPAVAEPTTIMLRHVPELYTSAELLDLLNRKGFQGLYDFVYLPIDFQNRVNLGYAFVNLLDHAKALHFKNEFEQFLEWGVEGAEAAEITWAHPYQGLEQHIERYRNSPVMHPATPEEYKPMIFFRGQKVLFPAPTRTIKAPKLRNPKEKPPSS